MTLSSVVLQVKALDRLWHSLELGHLLPSHQSFKLTDSLVNVWKHALAPYHVLLNIVIRHQIDQFLALEAFSNMSEDCNRVLGLL